jgi:Flp pilus assembly protein TadG
VRATTRFLHRAPRLQRAQALVEFALVMPVMLALTLGMIDLGRAFVFGVAVQEGTRQAARLAASAYYDVNIDDGAVLGRLVAASAPALAGCAASAPASQNCNGGVWTFNVQIVKGGTTYSSSTSSTPLADARNANNLTGATVTVTARGSVALVPGVSTGAFGIVLPQIVVQGNAAMVIL